MRDEKSKKVEVLLPPWIVSNMEKLTQHSSREKDLAAFVEHSKVVASWDVWRQRSFGGRLLRQMVPRPLSRLFASTLNALKLSNLHREAIRFGSATMGAVTSRWLVGDTRVLSVEEDIDA